MKALEIGEKVAAYNGMGREIGEIISAKPAGDPDFFYIKFPTDSPTHISGFYHRNQIRKLVKRKTRTIWAKPTPINGIMDRGYDAYTTAEPWADGWIEFREVRKKK